MIALLGHRERYRRARVADALPPAHALREVEVAERHVGDVAPEEADRHRLLVADLALAVLGNLPSHHEKVARSDQRLALAEPRLRRLADLFVDAFQAGDVVVPAVV